MFLLPIILAASTASPTALPAAQPLFDQWGFPRLTPGEWTITTKVTAPIPSNEAWNYCIQPNYSANLMQQFMERNKPDDKYNCSISSSAPGVGSAFCTKLSTTQGGMSVILKLNWQVTSNPGANFQANVSGNVQMGSGDKRQPSGNTPVVETITGVYLNASCSSPQPQPASVGTQ